MRRASKSRVIQNLLGSARLFASAVHEFAEDAMLHELDDEPLTLARLDLLELVSHCPNSTVSHAAAVLGTSNAAASKLVDKLVRAGYLARLNRDLDRRSYLLRLTPRGVDVLNRFAAAQGQALAPLLDPIDNNRLEVTAHLLDEVAARLAGREPVSDVCLRCGAYVRGSCGPRLGHPEKCLSVRARVSENNKTRARHKRERHTSAQAPVQGIREGVRS